MLQAPAPVFHDYMASRCRPLPDNSVPKHIGSIADEVRSYGEVADSLTRMLRSVRLTLGMDIAFVTEFTGGQRVIRDVETATVATPLRAGDTARLEETACYRIVAGMLPELIADLRAHPPTDNVLAPEGIGARSQLCVPIRLWDGRVHGTLGCVGFEPRPSLDDRDLQMMRAFAEFAAYQIDRELEVVRRREQAKALVRAVIDKGQLSVLYQPIFRLEEGCVVGFECLSRFSASPSRTPDMWFSEAAEIGLSQELELAAIRLALEGLACLPEPVYLTLNLSPATIMSGELANALEGQPAERIVLEITEHSAVADYAKISRSLEALRRRGLRIAVDDAGAGYASLRHILNLRPDLIKLDISLTRRIDRDDARRALASALIGFARVTSSEIIAEGVETASELKALKALGAGKAQGFHLGKPMSLESARQLCMQKPRQALLEEDRRGTPQRRARGRRSASGHAPR
jgi:EAL domain-containing protein (putative c-di-GMP-specific phosphodiesterase class I)